jgi:hypothetical protein
MKEPQQQNPDDEGTERLEIAAQRLLDEAKAGL